MGVYTELTVQSANYHLLATFHGQFHVDGSLCPLSCSNLGTCNQGYCDCGVKYTGAYCQYNVTQVYLNQNIAFNLQTTERLIELVTTGGKSTLEVEVTAATTTVTMAILEASLTGYLVPSPDYASQTYTLHPGDTSVSIPLKRSPPVYISIAGESKGEVTFRFSSPKGDSHSDSSTDTSRLVYIIVGVSAPVTLVMAFLSVIILCYVRNHRRRSQPVEASPVLSLNPKKEIALLGLNFISSETPFHAIDCQFGDVCPVCLEGFEKDTLVRMLPCRHVYHSECLVNLACIQQVCCICKQTFDRKLDQSMTTLGDFTRLERDMSP